MTPVKQGSVYNNYSNLVLVVAVDGAAIRAWKGYEHPAYEELSERLFGGDDVSVDLEDRTGVLFDMGGCGSSNVFRIADDDIALVEHYSADWNPEIEAQFLAVVGAGIGDDAHPIGTVEVTSGVLALLHAGDPGDGDVSAPAVGTATELECHLLLGVPNGRYVLLGERLEAKGGWGTIETRVRIVREESVARAREGALVAPAAKPALPDCVRHAGRMELPDGMDFVSSLALAETPWLVAGQKSGPMIAAWSAASGELAWSAELDTKATSHEYAQKVMVSIHGDRIAAAVGEHLVILALDSGDELARHALGAGTTAFARMIGSSSSFARFAPDGVHVLVGQLPTVRVLDVQTGAERARIEGCSGTCDAPASPDGSLIALPGVELRLVDARTFAVTRTIALPGYATAAAFSPAGDVLAIASGGVVTFYDVATGAAGALLPAASTVTEIGVGAIAWSTAGLIATASADGYVRLWRAQTRELVGELPGHDTTTPGTGARSLHGLAFSPKGDVLFVGGGPPGEHALAAYLLA